MMRAAARFSAWLVVFASLPIACSNKLETRACDRLRGDAFDVLNKGQQCDTDADCRQSDWPGCAKPLSNASWEKIKPMGEAYKQGQCEEPKIECREPPEVYCKQGLCVHREKGAANTPIDPIQVK